LNGRSFKSTTPLTKLKDCGSYSSRNTISTTELLKI